MPFACLAVGSIDTSTARLYTLQSCMYLKVSEFCIKKFHKSESVLKSRNTFHIFISLSSCSPSYKSNFLKRVSSSILRYLFNPLKKPSSDFASIL